MVIDVGVEPRVRAVPEAVSWELADEALEFVRSVGVVLDGWQEDVLRASLGRRADGKFAAFETGLNVARQNGKGEVLLARQLAGLFVLGEEMVIHSAHQFDTSMEAFHRLEWVIDDNRDLKDRVKKVSRSHGSEGFELRSGPRIRFRTRTKGGGRGFSADCLILDEAMFLPEFGYGALLPILSARENPQVWYTGSAVDQEVHDDGVVFARVRERGVSGKDPRLAYFEWSLPYERPEDVPEDGFVDPGAWAQANPAFGTRISEEHIGNEQRALDARTFAVERLGVGDWPDVEGSQHVIDMKLWGGLVDVDSEMLDPLCFTFDVSPDRSRATISVAGNRADGLGHVEVVRRDAGTQWVPTELARLTSEHECLRPRCDAKGPAASLLPEIERLGVRVDTVDAGGMAKACGQFFDAAQQRALRHLGTSELTSALKGAAQRPLGDAWAWHRKNSSVDITPLVSVTLALSGVMSQRAAAPMIGAVAR